MMNATIFSNIKVLAQYTDTPNMTDRKINIHTYMHEHTHIHTSKHHNNGVRKFASWLREHVDFIHFEMKMSFQN